MFDRARVLNHKVHTSSHLGYQVQVSEAREDPQWDAFLAQTPGGHHIQTSLWAQVKAALGWRAVRVTVTSDDGIAAGAQVLIRPFSLAGAIGYVPKGPLVTVDDPVVMKLVIDAVHQIAKAHRVHYLVVQPPDTGHAIAAQLPSRGFRPSATVVAPTATVVFDLLKNEDDLLAQMKGKTRQHLRRGLREGITVCEGTEDDLRTYYRILVATSQRQHFSTYPEIYFRQMWRVLYPHGYIKLFLAEYENEVVSAQLAIPFGTTVTNKLTVWSGNHASRRPNEVLNWTAIMWAKAHGYRCYDFEGVTPKIAKAIVHGERLPDASKRSVTSFKLGFGGQVILYPEAYDYVYNPLLRWGYYTMFPKIATSATIKNARRWVRTRS